MGEIFRCDVLAGKIRVGVIGAGFIVKFAHLPSLKILSSRFEVKVVFSKSIENAKIAALEYSVPEATDDWRSIVQRSDVDAVIIATPNYTHKTIAVEAARAGKHILLEKPVALRLKDAVEIVKECEKAGVKLLVAHCLRFWPEYVKVRELILSGTIGEPRVVRAYRLSLFPGKMWHKFMEFSGGVTVDLMIHDIDYSIWILGDVEEVYGVKLRVTGNTVDSPDHSAALLKFKSSAIAYLEASWAFPRGYPFTTYLEIAGSKGLLTVDNRTTQTITIYRNGVAESTAPLEIRAYVEQLKAFAEWIDRDVKPPIDPWEAVKALQVALAVLESSEKNAVVKISEVV